MAETKKARAVDQKWRINLTCPRCEHRGDADVTIPSTMNHDEHPADEFRFGCPRCFTLLTTVFRHHATATAPMESVAADVASSAREEVVLFVEHVRDLAIANMGDDTNKRAAAGGMNALVRHLRIRFGEESEEERRARVRRMAAATDLFEALTEVLAYLGPKWVGPRDRAHAALAKATEPK